MAYEIKELQWSFRSKGCWFIADSVFGNYLVEKRGPDDWVWASPDDTRKHEASSFEAAISAAEHHYKTRILSAFVVSPC